MDVGFGDFSMHPLKLVLNTPLHDRNGTFLIERYDDTYARVSRLSLKENRYLPEYLFSEKERSLGDFAGMCDYHQTSPESHFTRKRVCSIATATGRKTLTEDRLIVTERGVRTETVIGDESAYRRALQHHFGVLL